jgi:hypothetical protein
VKVGPDSHFEYKDYKKITLNDTYDDFDIHYFKSSVRIVLWNNQSVFQLDRSGNEFYLESIQAETVGVRQTSILFTKQNKIGFLR